MSREETNTKILFYPIEPTLGPKRVVTVAIDRKILAHNRASLCSGESKHRGPIIEEYARMDDSLDVLQNCSEDVGIAPHGSEQFAMLPCNKDLEYVDSTLPIGATDSLELM